MRSDFDARWMNWREVLADEGVAFAAPKATLCEIEAALDARLGQDAGADAARCGVSQYGDGYPSAQGAEQPRCAACGSVLVERAVTERQLLTQHSQVLALVRITASVPVVGQAFFPPG